MTVHDHSHTPDIQTLNKAFILGIVLNSLFVIVEAASGFYLNSMALLSDAGHNLGDVASLLLAMLAYRLAKMKPTSTFTYGYRKSTILVSLINAVVLFIAVGGIMWESMQRIQNPEIINGKYMVWVASAGIVINTMTALLFFKGKDGDLNIKGAYLHMAADALVSLGVVIAGVVIIFTGWYWLDGVSGMLIAVVILWGTIGLLKDSLNLSMDAVPKGITLAEIDKQLKGVAGVTGIHHVHVWAISTTYNALTAHVVVPDETTMDELVTIKQEIRHRLSHMNIAHSTLEFERGGEVCGDDV
ncbi:MAG: cation transporter [Saprospiraceae bacterium]|nr:cation transporter [Saprospiraceae bacterium]